MTLPFTRATSLVSLECYLDAFTGTAFTWRFRPPTRELMRAWTLVRFVRRFEDPTDQQFKIVEETSSQVVAFARWDVPSGMKGLSHSRGKQEIPEGVNEEVFHEFFAGIKHMQAKWDAKSKLDTEGITAYLEALPNAKAMYEHYGFKTADTQEYDLTKAGREGTEMLSIMVREPMKAST
ncbi:hypothetical protein B0H14DRAFT_3775501 [Mycena olivaceomarginata]|nr:hypothetical protein B0H14DRAFT_3775501 [Mycena olivaceomarginata]